MNAGARLLTATPQRHRYALTLRIEEGPQYRLGNVRFQPVDPDKESLAFSKTEFRQLFYMHMRRSDFLNVTKSRAAMLELTQLYDAIGYIDMVPEPGLDIDDTSRIIDLTMKIDEEPQYRVGKIDFLGLDEKTQSQLCPTTPPRRSLQSKSRG